MLDFEVGLEGDQDAEEGLQVVCQSSGYQSIGIMFQVNLNITEAEEEAIGGEKIADLSEKPNLTEEESASLGEVEADLVPGEFVDKKLSVWEEDSLWDNLGEENEVVWDLGQDRDEDGGGRVYFPVPQLPSLVEDEDEDEDEGLDGDGYENKDGGGRVYFPVPQLPALESAPMLDDLPLLSWGEQHGGESKDVESNVLSEEQDVLFVEEDQSLLLGAGFQNANSNMASDEDGIEQVMKPMDGKNVNVTKINSDKIENSPVDRNTIVSQIFDDNVIDYDAINNDEVKIDDKVTMKVVIVDTNLITKKENGEPSKKEEVDEDMEMPQEKISDKVTEKENGASSKKNEDMPENATEVDQRPEKEETKEEGKGKSKAQPRSIGNARTLAASKKVVKTLDGLVQGVEGRTDQGKVFHKYLGVPYAAPPLGDLRCNFNRRNC